MPRIKKLQSLKSVIVAAYANGASIEELASVYGASPGTVRLLLKQEGVQLRRPGRRKKQ